MELTPICSPSPSKLWIVWVVVGVVLLGIVALAAVFIPLALGMLQGGGAASGESVDERAAIETVQTYDSAWRDGDCDAYVASTTEYFRDYLGIADCETFQVSAAEFAATTSGYELTVTDIETGDGEIVLQTRETYMSSVDEYGSPLPEPQRLSTIFPNVPHEDKKDPRDRSYDQSDEERERWAHNPF